jgi:hypothetical protein
MEVFFLEVGLGIWMGGAEGLEAEGVWGVGVGLDGVLALLLQVC